MKSKVNEVIECFSNGFNCSQAILSTYCEEFGLDKETALKLSCGFGGGMGRCGATCGAVTGAYLLISLAYGQCEKNDDLAKEKTYALVQEFAKKFEERNKTTICRELLEVDLMNGDKQKASQQVSKICPKVIKDAAEIIESILFV